MLGPSQTLQISYAHYEGVFMFSLSLPQNSVSINQGFVLVSPEEVVKGSLPLVGSRVVVVAGVGQLLVFT